MKQNTHHRINKELLEMLRGDSARERLLHRLHCVVMAMNGSSASEAARIYGDSPRAVAYWVTQFKLQGIDGLIEESRPGRPSKLNQSQLAKVQSFLGKHESEPKSVKAEIVSEFISKEFGITLTVRQCWRIVDRLTA